MSDKGIKIHFCSVILVVVIIKNLLNLLFILKWFQYS